MWKVKLKCYTSRSAQKLIRHGVGVDTGNPSRVIVWWRFVLPDLSHRPRRVKNSGCCTAPVDADCNLAIAER